MGDIITGVLATVGGLFLFGTLWFWVISSVIFGWLIFLTEGDEVHPFGAGFVLFGFIWIMASVNDFSVLANPLLWLKWAAIYLVIGVVWSIIKWFSFLHKQKDKLTNLKEAYVKRHELELVDKRIAESDWQHAEYLVFLLIHVISTDKGPTQSLMENRYHPWLLHHQPQTLQQE